jgi:hypothetical protein
MDEEDSIFLERSHDLTIMRLVEAEFEYIMDTLEKHQCERSRVALPESSVFDVDTVEHLFITKRLRTAASVVYPYWKEKRRRTNLLRRFAHFSSSGPFAAFVSRPGPRNQRRRRFGRDCEIYDDYHSFILLQQLRMQSVVARDIFEKIVFREYRKRERVSSFHEALSLSAFPGKPTAGPLHVQDIVEPPVAPKFKVVFKVAPTAHLEDQPIQPSSLPFADESAQLCVNQDAKLPKKPKRGETEGSERKKKASGRTSKRLPPIPIVPRVIFLPLDSSPSDDEALAYVDSDSDEFDLPDTWPRPLEDDVSDNDSLEQPDYALNPRYFLRPSITDDEFALSRFADFFGRQSVHPLEFVSFLDPSCPPHQSRMSSGNCTANLQRSNFGSFRGRRRIGRAGRVVWDRFGVHADQIQSLSGSRLRMSAETPSKRIKLAEDPVVQGLQMTLSSSDTPACVHTDSSSSSELLVTPELSPPATHLVSTVDTPTVSPEPSKTLEQYDSSDDVILIPDAGIPPYLDVSVATDPSTHSFLSSSTSIRVSSYPYYGSSGT